MPNCSEPIRVGVVGCGRIAKRFVEESHAVAAIEVVAVCNVRLASAQRFAAEHGLAAFDDLNAFLAEVDAVYIAAPHATHYPYALQALEAGKHVMCEKPMALEAAQCEHLFEVAEERGLVLMEALKTAYTPGFIQLVECAKSGKIGQVVGVDATFTKLVPHDSRELQDEGVAGSVTELGTYPLLAILSILGTEFTGVQFYSHQTEDVKGDLFTQGNVVFDGAVGNMRVGLGVKSEGHLVVSGTEGYLYAPAPWWKTERFEARFEDQSQNEHFEIEYEGDGLRYEQACFAQQVRSGQPDPQAREISLALARLMGLYRSGDATTFF